MPAPDDAATHFYRPAEGHGLPHDPLKAIVAPRPIGWISTLSVAGVPNVAPYSFFTLLGSRPPLIGFSSEGFKDSAANIAATGEFCWNLATRPLAAAVNRTSAPVGADVDEFVLAGLTAAPSRQVRAPHVGESPVVFECRMADQYRLRTAAGEQLDQWFTVGEVVGVHIDRTVLVDGIYRTTATEPVLRGGGVVDWFGVAEEQRFEMPRPPG